MGVEVSSVNAYTSSTMLNLCPLSHQAKHNLHALVSNDFLSAQVQYLYARFAVQCRARTTRRTKYWNRLILSIDSLILLRARKEDLEHVVTVGKYYKCIRYIRYHIIPSEQHYGNTVRTHRSRSKGLEYRKFFHKCLCVVWFPNPIECLVEIWHFLGWQ